MTELEQDISQIQNMIFVIRGHKVMLDSDLAKLYGVETGILNRQVKRNLNRFPSDFMIQITEIEVETLRCQNGISNTRKGGRRYLPYAFTENGIAMLSSVLTIECAVEINISIMRIFTKLRSFYVLEGNLATEVKELKDNSNKLFKLIFERLDSIDEDLTPKLPANRKKVGIKTDQ